MDEIEKRLREASERCIASYEAWRDKKGREGGMQESLQEAVHELRKVASRLEIEIAVSERNEMTQKPIPIPPHRSSRPRNNHEDVFGGDEGNHQPQPEMQQKPMRRPRRPMPPHGQHGNHGNGNGGNGPESAES